MANRAALQATKQPTHGSALYAAHGTANATPNIARSNFTALAAAHL